MGILTFAAIVARYPIVSTVGSAADVTSAWVVYAENDINARLGNAFTVPFSSNNLTALDLMIDNFWLRYQRSNNSDLSKTLKEDMDERIKRLTSGTDQMLLVDGTVLNASAGIGDPWSNTQNYEPVFGMGDETTFHVDSSQVYDEAVARGDWPNV